MSANSPEAQRLLDALLKDGPREKKIDAKQPPCGHELLRPSSAEVALFRAATHEDAPLKPPSNLVLVPAGRETEEIGCDFIEATNLLLRALDCPPKVRHFILCICGVTRGDSKCFHKVSDEHLSERLGVHRNTVGEYRQALYQWMLDKSTCVIEVTERELDPQAKKYKPTEYRAVIIPYAAEFVKRARGISRYATRPDFAITDAIDDGLKELAEGVAGEMPLANLESIKRRKQKRASEKSTPLEDFAELSRRKRAQVLELIAEVRDLEYTRGVEFEKVMEQFLSDVNSAMSATPMRYVLSNQAEF